MDNKALGVGSVVLGWTMKVGRDDHVEDAGPLMQVQVTILPTDFLHEDTNSIISECCDMNVRTGKKPEQVASHVFQTMKKAYTGKGYSAKLEVVIEVPAQGESGHYKRVHCAG